MSPKWAIYITLTPQILRDHHRKGCWKNMRAGKWRGELWSAAFWYDMDISLLNSQKLWLTSEVKKKIGCRRGNWRPTPSSGDGVSYGIWGSDGHFSWVLWPLVSCSHASGWPHTLCTHGKHYLNTMRYFNKRGHKVEDIWEVGGEMQGVDVIIIYNTCINS